jgi:hypothetical protein
MAIQSGTGSYEIPSSIGAAEMGTRPASLFCSLKRESEWTYTFLRAHRDTLCVDRRPQGPI